MNALAVLFFSLVIGSFQVESEIEIPVESETQSFSYDEDFMCFANIMVRQLTPLTVEQDGYRQQFRINRIAPSGSTQIWGLPGGVSFINGSNRFDPQIDIELFTCGGIPSIWVNVNCPAGGSAIASMDLYDDYIIPCW